MTQRQQQRVQPRMPAPAQQRDARAQLGVGGERVERFRQIAEVADGVEGPSVRTQVAVDQPRVLAGARQLPEAAADGRQQPQDAHRRALRARARKPVLSPGRRIAASRFQRLSRS